MKLTALMLPAVPLLLAGLGWWASGSLVPKMVKPQPAPVVAQIALPPGIESLAPTGPRPPLGYLELAAFGFQAPQKPVVVKVVKVVKPRIPTAGDLYVVDSVLGGANLSTATIGNKTFKVGDKLDKKYTVTAIARDGVWVQGAGERDLPEKIGFRSPLTAPEVAHIDETNPAPKPAPSGAPVSKTPDGLRDFRQILETLKL
jgi:hypothetical protein